MHAVPNAAARVSESDHARRTVARGAHPTDRVRHLRVLLVCDSLDIGGAERHVVSLATALARRGHDATVACSRPGPLDAELAASGVTLRALSDGLVKRRVSASYAQALTELVRAHRFDLVHAHMHASAAAAAVACARTSVPLVITEHTEATWRDARDWRTSRSAYRRAAHVIAVSASIGRRLVEVDRVPPRRVAAIPNAIPLPGGALNPLTRRLASREPLIGTVARLVPEKGVEQFLLAAATILGELPRARFVVIGDGPLRESLVGCAERLGIADRVRFLGARIDGPQLITQLDVLAIPSLGNEGTPLVTLEALSAGVPVVASAVGGIPEQARRFACVTLVPPGDAAALAREIVATVRSAPRVAPASLPLPRHEEMVRATETVYFRVCAEVAVRRERPRVGVLAQQWVAL